MRAFLRWFEARGDMRAVSLFRIGAGPLAIAHLWPFARDVLHGTYYRESFYVPWFAHYPEPSRPVYGALIALGMLAAAAMSFGLWSRLAARTCFAVVTYNFFLSETFFHHNRAFLLIFLGGLSLTHCGDHLSLDARFARMRPPPRKLFDPDWFAGIVTWDRVERYRAAYAHVLPPAWLDLAANPHLHFWLAKGVIALELSVGIGLWFARTRYLAAWLALVFHGMIQLTAEIQVFSLLGIAGLLIWVTPRTRQRRLLLRLDTPSGLRWQRWLKRLDWLGRFELRAADGGEVLTLIERDGRRYVGRAARLRVLARLPLCAPFALPCIGFDLSPHTARLNPLERLAASPPGHRPTSS
jgi:hypothetical protein